MMNLGISARVLCSGTDSSVGGEISDKTNMVKIGAVNSKLHLQRSRQYCLYVETDS